MKKPLKKTTTLGELKKDIHDVFSAVSKLATHVDKRLDGTDKRLDGIDKKMTTFVTKDYLDERIALVRGDLVQLARKNDAKTMRLAGDLYDEGVLSEKSLKTLYEMEPFPVPTVKR